MLKRNTKYALIAIGVVSLLLVVWGFLANAVAKRSFAVAKAELIRQGARLKIADLYPPPDASLSNGADQFTNTVASFPYLDSRLLRESMGYAGPGRAMVVSRLTNWPVELRGRKWADDIWTEIHPLVDPHRHSLTKALTAVTNDVLYMAVPFQEKHFAALMPHLSGIRNVCHLTLAGTLSDIRLGEQLSAQVRLQQALRFIRKYDEPTYISQLVRIAGAHTLVRASWESLVAAAWTESQWAAIQSEWEAFEFGAPMIRAVKLERAVGLRYWEELIRDPVGADSMIAGGKPKPPVAALFSSVVNLVTGKGGWSDVEDNGNSLFWLLYPAYADGAFYLETMQTNIVQFESVVRAGSLSVGGGYTSVIPEQFRFSNMVMSPLESIEKKLAKMEVERGLVISAIALKRFQMKQGRLPESLGELVPNYLQEVPIDWFDGKPLRYEKETRGAFRLWSVGSDRIDDRATKYDPKKRWDNDRDIYWPMPALDSEIEARRRDLDARKALTPKP